MNSISATMLTLRTQFEAALEAEVSAWSDWPDSLVTACRHSLFGGGKRVRPVLSMMVAEALERSAEDVLPWAMAVELIHTYSLVHDDLPAMDNDDMRRGRPTCHIEFGEANAILAGDALLTEAFGVLARGTYDAQRSAHLVAALVKAAGGAGMVAGQIYDMGGDLDNVAKIRHMQALKTGALIRAAAEGPAIMLGASATLVHAMATYGEALGALFQITDDILDREEDGDDDGKNLINHMSLEQVIELRDETVNGAIGSLAEMGDSAESLRQFVHHIAHRVV